MTHGIEDKVVVITGASSSWARRPPGYAQPRVRAWCWVRGASSAT